MILETFQASLCGKGKKKEEEINKDIKPSIGDNFHPFFLAYLAAVKVISNIYLMLMVRSYGVACSAKLQRSPADFL